MTLNERSQHALLRSYAEMNGQGAGDGNGPAGGGVDGDRVVAGRRSSVGKTAGANVTDWCLFSAAGAEIESGKSENDNESEQAQGAGARTHAQDSEYSGEQRGEEDAAVAERRTIQCGGDRSSDNIYSHGGGGSWLTVVDDAGNLRSDGNSGTSIGERQDGSPIAGAEESGLALHGDQNVVGPSYADREGAGGS